MEEVLNQIETTFVTCLDLAIFLWLGFLDWAREWW